MAARLDDRYRPIRDLGGDELAVVRLAEDEELRRPVALKCLSDAAAGDDEVRRRFVREARLAASLAHPNVVRVYDTGELDGRPFVAMEYVEGETLADVLARRGPLPEPEARRLVAQAAAGLEAVHAAGLSHGNVRPKNLLLRRDGVLKLIGLGGHGHEAPEDVRALGAVLYGLLTGEQPRAEPLVTPVRELAPACSPDLERLVMRCLAGLPDRRPTAAELARALLDRREPEPTATPRTRSRRPLAVAAAAALAAAAAAGIGLTRDDRPAPRPTPARVAAVPHAQNAAAQAGELSRWIRRYSR
jgi:serine/threonine-protein kinase